MKKCVNFCCLFKNDEKEKVKKIDNKKNPKSRLFVNGEKRKKI